MKPAIDVSDMCTSDSDLDGEVYYSSYSSMDCKMGIMSNFKISTRTTTTKLETK